MPNISCYTFVATIICFIFMFHVIWHRIFPFEILFSWRLWHDLTLLEKLKADIETLYNSSWRENHALVDSLKTICLQVPIGIFFLFHEFTWQVWSFRISTQSQNSNFQANQYWYRLTRVNFWCKKLDWFIGWWNRMLVQMIAIRIFYFVFPLVSKSFNCHYNAFIL